MEKSRYINFIKGLAIFLMIWGHVIQYGYINTDFDFFENQVFKFIYSFHMPLFMTISGYLFYYSSKNRNLKELIFHKIKAIGYPLLIFSLIYTSFSLNLGQQNSLFTSSTISWYLWSIIALSIVTSFIIKISDNFLIKILFFILGFFIIFIFPNYNMNIFMYPYFIIGLLFAKIKTEKEIKSLIIHIIGLISIPLFIFLLMHYKKEHYIYTTGIFYFSYSLSKYIFIDFFRWFIGLVGTVVICYITHLIFKIKKLSNIYIYIENLGKYSLQIYLISILIVSTIYPRLLNIILGENICLLSNLTSYSFIYCFFIAIIFCILIYYISLFLTKNLPFLFYIERNGKKE